MDKGWSFETLLIHGGLEPGPAGATTVPIVQSSAFAYATADDLEDVFRGRRAGQVYTRLGNPTTENLERRLALLEGGRRHRHRLGDGGDYHGGADDPARRRRDPFLLLRLRRHLLPFS